MLNKAMQRKIESGEALDLKDCRRLGPYYVIPQAADSIEGFDLCDSRGEVWIWSAGIVERPMSFKYLGVEVLVPKGTHLASGTADLYQREGVRCTFLR